MAQITTVKPPWALDPLRLARHLQVEDRSELHNSPLIRSKNSSSRQRERSLQWQAGGQYCELQRII